jgi:hypothetical protein
LDELLILGDKRLVDLAKGLVESSEKNPERVGIGTALPGVSSEILI